MKILFVIPSITNYFTFLEELISRLVAHGHDIHIATSRQHITDCNPYDREPVCSMHAIDFPRALTLFRHLKAARSLQRLVEEFQPDLISIHFSAAIFTSMLAKKPSWPVTVGTVHGLGSPLIKGWRKTIIALAEKWAFKRIDELYVLTSDDQAYLQKKSVHTNVQVINSKGLGCNLNKFDPSAVSAQRKTSLHMELGLSPEHFVYIFIGRQTSFKGFDKVLSAFYLTLQTHPRSRLLLVGAKDLIHPISKANSKSTAVASAVINVGWQENVAEYLAISNLNVFPSEREGMPVNLMESLAMGVPVLTVESRGCKEVVTHDKTGLVLRERSVKSFADGMRYLQDNPQKLEQFSINAFREREIFDREHYIKNQFTTIYKLTGCEVHTQKSL